MKIRRVFVTLEIETNAALADLRSAEIWQETLDVDGFNPNGPATEAPTTTVLQAQANVAKN